jgi:hypothetical protein
MFQILSSKSLEERDVVVGRFFGGIDFFTCDDNKNT